MMKPFPLELWMGVQLIIDLFFVIFLLGFIRRLNREKEENRRAIQQEDEVLEVRNTALAALEKASRVSRDIMDSLESLVRGAEEAAISFEEQIKEKKRLIKGLNDVLDSKIISINMLISRAEVLLKSQNTGSFHGASPDNRPCDNKKHWEYFERSGSHQQPDVFDQQKNIIEWYHQGVEIGTIASRLAMPRGEVELVINLKKKFLKMEKER